MPGRVASSNPNMLGYASYGMPQNPAGALTSSYADPRGRTGAPILGPPSITPAGYNPTGVPVIPSASRAGSRLPNASYPRLQGPGPYARGLGVAAMTPQLGAIAAARQMASTPGVGSGYGTRGPNVISPLFGRPGMSYVYTRNVARIGPVPKLSPGTGQTAARGSNRAQGFVPAAHATEQFMPAPNFDYIPPTDPGVGPGEKAEFNQSDLPKTIHAGTDGRDLVSTYKPHDFIVADRFFKQGRSSGYWQDQSFGPDYRYLLGVQQAARYNLYNEIALARPLSPNAYFLGYQTQPAQAAQIGGVGQGRPLGY